MGQLLHSIFFFRTNDINQRKRTPFTLLSSLRLHEYFRGDLQWENGAIDAYNDFAFFFLFCYFVCAHVKCSTIRRFGPKKISIFFKIYGVLSFCEEKRIQEGISLPLVSYRSCNSAHPQSGSIFLLVNEKLSDAKISIISSTFPAVKCHCLETIEGRVVI